MLHEGSPQQSEHTLTPVNTHLDIHKYTPQMPSLSHTHTFTHLHANMNPKSTNTQTQARSYTYTLTQIQTLTQDVHLLFISNQTRVLKKNFNKASPFRKMFQNRTNTLYT